MRKQWTRILLGLILVLAGVGYAGNALGFWHFGLFFDGWWTLFIIVPCLLSIVDHGFEACNVIGLGIGLILRGYSTAIFNGFDMGASNIPQGMMLFISAQGLIGWHTMMRLLFPLILICIGVGLIFRPHRNPEVAHVVSTTNMDGAPEITAIFGTETRRIVNDITGGASLTAVFGTLTIDLRDANIQRDIVVQATAVFRTVNLLLPEGTPVKIDGFSLFGGVSNHMPSPGAEGRPVVYVSGTSVFGSTEVKA